MKLERCLVGTPQEMLAAQLASDKALGFPRPGVHVGGGRHVPMPTTWDGQGACPPGWTATASAPVLDKDGAAYLAITGNEGALVDPAILAKLQAAEVQAISKVDQAQLYDLGTIASDAAAAQDAKEAAIAEVTNTPIDFVGAGIGAVSVIAEIISQFL
jgi:hypothetical protein